MRKVGIELGIRAPIEAIQKAAAIAEANDFTYYFVPETNPKVMGVDAFSAINALSGTIKKVKLGTGIINVFSRTEEQILQLSQNVYQKTNHNFVLGLGTSAPAVIEKMYGIKFERPLLRLKMYTQFLKNNYGGPIYWATVGDKITELATQYADGAIFFLKPADLIKENIRKIETKLTSLGKSSDSFEIISIRPTFINKSTERARKAASFTLASYIGANEFYSKPLVEHGFEKEVQEIRENFRINGLLEASKKVSDKMIDELTTYGTIEDCKTNFDEYFDKIHSNIIIGLDLPQEGYNKEFFENLEQLACNMK